MKYDDIFWNLVTLVVLIVTAAVPVYATYDVWLRGSAPEKQLELQIISPIYPLDDLSSLKDRAKLSLKIDDQTLDNIAIAQTRIENIGKSPIIPSDFVEPITVSVKQPWKIIAVANRMDFPEIIPAKWKRVDDATYSAEPTLINPEDIIWVFVYLTKAEQLVSEVGHKQKAPDISWNTRIINLRSFTKAPDHFEEVARTRWGIQVELYGWAVPFVIFSIFVFQALYLHLLYKAGFLTPWNQRSIIIVVASGLLSVAAAECIATYLFFMPLTDFDGVNHWMNAPIITLHLFAILALHSLTKRSSIS